MRGFGCCETLHSITWHHRDKSLETATLSIGWGLNLLRNQSRYTWEETSETTSSRRHRDGCALSGWE